jgi:DNA-directed RNA polymerase specialized sigma subunit
MNSYWKTPVTKERLRKSRRLLIEIENQQERIARLTAQAERITTTLTFARTSGTADNDKLTAYIAAKDKLTGALLNNLTLIATEAAEITRAVSELSDSTERQVITLYYIDCLKWDEVAARLRYSTEQIYRLHGYALRNLLQITQEGSK